MKEVISGVEIRKTFQELPVWKGAPVSDTYGDKPVLDFNGSPVFAELFALRVFKEKGFDGVWADSYRKTFRTELPDINELKIALPEFVNEKLDRINPNGKISGTWDLILWKDSEIKFVEIKRKGKDKIRQTQIDFLKRALDSGVRSEDFEIYEWNEK